MTAINSGAFVRKLGLFLGFIVAMTAVGGGIELIQRGKDGYGLAAIIGALASLAGVFIYTKNRRKDLDDRNWEKDGTFSDIWVDARHFSGGFWRRDEIMETRAGGPSCQKSLKA